MDFEWGPSVETVLQPSAGNTCDLKESLNNCLIVRALNDCSNNVANGVACDVFQVPNIIRNPIWGNKRKYEHEDVKSSNFNSIRNHIYLSTSLCYISLFFGCWNIAYGGDPLCWDWGSHAKIAVLMPRLWCSCQDCGAYAKIAVLMPGLRCSCQDCGAHAKIEVLMLRLRCSSHLNLGMSTAISAWAPQTRHEHLNPSTATTSANEVATTN